VEVSREVGVNGTNLGSQVDVYCNNHSPTIMFNVLQTFKLHPVSPATRQPQP